MGSKNGLKKDNLSFSSYILILCILVVVPVLFFVSVSDYHALSDNFKTSYIQLQQNTEESIIESIKVVNTGLEIYDKTFDDRMKAAFVPFIEAYNSSGGDPEKLDLYALKEKLGPEYDLYLINRDHIVQYSTKELDLGIDFSGNKEFSDHLDSIFESKEYRGDRIVRSYRDFSAVNKYAYYPAPDGRYILELSYSIKDYADTRNRLRFKNAADEIKEMNPYLISVRIYDIHGFTVDEPDMPEEKTRNFIQNNIILPKQDYTTENKTANTVTRYRYVDLYDPAVGMDMSVAIAFTYSTAAIEEELEKILFSKAISFLLILILLMIVFYLTTDFVTKPLRHLTEDVDKIADGDLDHKIRAYGGREFLRLRDSVENMVGRLKSSIEESKQSEETIKKYNEELEGIVERRTDELRSANEESNFYIDMMTHDINNANMAAIGYAQIIEESDSDITREFASKVISAVYKSTEIIANVSLIRTIRHKKIEPVPVSLDKVVLREISHFPDADINYAESGFSVLADELLGEVFSNLIGNSIKYAGEGCRIQISSVEKDGRIKTCVDDNGPGVSGASKEHVFEKLFRDEKTKIKIQGKGLGLYIVKSLVEKYGGSVYACNRAEETGEEGFRICITLKKAEPSDSSDTDSES